MEKKKCDCSFCKLREIENEQANEHLKWLQEQKDKFIKSNQDRNLELIDLCVRHRND
jgi:hypothetical protein